MLMPQMDVSETERELKICAELPGVSEKDIDIRLEDDVLVIRAEKKFECKDEKENYHFMERSYGTFQRALRLPGPGDSDQIQASFENGVLTLNRAEERAAGALASHPGSWRSPGEQRCCLLEFARALTRSIIFSAPREEFPEAPLDRAKPTGVFPFRIS